MQLAQGADSSTSHSAEAKRLRFHRLPPYSLRQYRTMQKANLDSAKLEAYGVLIVAIGIKGILTWTE